MAVNLLALTTVNRKKLYQGQPTTSEATLYTATSVDVKLQSIVLCNTTGSTATVSLSVVTSAGTAGATNRILSAFSVAANDSVSIDTAIDLTSGDFISGLQGTASAVTVTISGETYA